MILALIIMESLVLLVDKYWPTSRTPVALALCLGMLAFAPLLVLLCLIEWYLHRCHNIKLGD